MKYSNAIKTGIYTLSFMLLYGINLSSQCDTGCEVQCVSQLNLSLDQTCQAEITPSMGGVGVLPGDPCYAVEVYDAYSNLIPDGIVNLDYLNENLTYKVIELECGNICWGKVRVEYKLPPQIECPPDLTIQCNALEYLCLPGAVGSCAGFSVGLRSEVKTKLDCDPDYNAVVRRTYEAWDEYGNFDTCSHLVYLERIKLSDIKFPESAVISCSDTLIRFSDDDKCSPLPWFHIVPGVPTTGSGSGSGSGTGPGSEFQQGVPILCNTGLPEEMLCYGVDGEVLNPDGYGGSGGSGGFPGLGGPTTGSGTGSGIGGIPLFPNGGGILIEHVHVDDTTKHYVVHEVPESNSNLLCNALLTYTDIVFPEVNGGCKKKIARTWEVREWWCSDEITTGNLQVITIIDDQAPTFDCPEDRTVSTTSDCAANILMPAVYPQDRCGEETIVRIEYANGFIEGDGGYANLDIGENIITYKVSDNCYNSTSCSVVYTVKDLNEPVAVCELDKVVSISTNTNTLVPAEVFDNGSYDDCNLAKIEVARMNNVCEPGVQFGTRVYIDNTYQSIHETNGQELPVEDIYEYDESQVHLDASVTPNNEFEGYLGKYNIDVSENNIFFSSIANDTNEPYPGYIRTLDYGSHDRYYFTFDEAHGIKNVSADNPYVTVSILSNTEILVELAEGYYTGDHGFTVLLDRFSEYVQFCCEDVIVDEVMVLFRVTDHSGNSNMCMVAVDVQDKAIPNLICPEDVTVDCRVTYDMANLDAVFGAPSLSDNCPSINLPNVTVEENMNQCGIGTMSRKFQLLDEAGNVIKSCTQQIIVTNEAPFLGLDIVWPIDYEIEGCDLSALDPDRLEAPYNLPSYYVAEDQCALLGYDYTDEVFSSNIGSNDCAVIQRTWTVINWCSSATGTFDTWTSPVPQLLKLRNSVAPILDEGFDVIVESQNIDCTSGDLHIIRQATDDCSSELTWDYTIIRAKDGAIVEKGSGHQIQGNYPAGAYIIEWQVKDGCGNSDSDIQKLDIINNKPPTPICHNGLSASLVGTDTNGDGSIDTEEAELWASDFNAGSYHNCGNPITFSFSSDTLDKFVIFDCSHLGLQNVEMYVTDVITGAQDFCIAFIDIQDAGTCPDAETVIVEGQVYTEQEQLIEGVEITLSDTNNFDMTDDEGTYAFRGMPMGGSYTVEAELDVDYLNGVSTVDIIMIQRHILGLEALDSPYKLLAADINNDQLINGVDLVELRKLVLGIYSELPQNTSWRFVTEEHSFVDALNPWMTEIPESYRIEQLNTDMIIDFIGVKIGDVNSSVAVNLTDLDEGFVQGEVHMQIPEINASFGERLTVPVYAENYTKLRGWQGTIEFDADLIQINGLVAAELELLPKQYNMSGTAAGWFTVSYNSDESQTFDDNEVLFYIDIEAKNGIKTSELFSMTSSVTKAEAYDNRLEIRSLHIGGTANETARIASISPNPWINNTTIDVVIPDNEEGILEFYDVNGRLLSQERRKLLPGQHQIEISRSEIQIPGLIYVKLITGSGSSEYKMILL